MVLGDDGIVLDRHDPAGEIDHSPAVSDMPGMTGSLQHWHGEPGVLAPGLNWISELGLIGISDFKIRLRSIVTISRSIATAAVSVFAAHGDHTHSQFGAAWPRHSAACVN